MLGERQGKEAVRLDIRTYLQDHIVTLDGGMGSLLMAQGLPPGERGERWVLTHPEAVEAVHTAYYNAGSNIVLTNTFGASRLHFTDPELEAIIPAAVRLARSAGARSTAAQEKFVALDIGPLGRFLAPVGELDFEEAVALFAQQVRLGADAGADLIFIETMNDLAETRAALLAAKENCGLPVFVSNSYTARGRLLTGASPAAMVAMLEGMGADVIGLNCSMGPEELSPLGEEYLRLASVPVLFKPNAGAPTVRGGETVYPMGPEPFAAAAVAMAAKGVRCVGGCCGTTPDHIAALTRALEGLAPLPVRPHGRPCVASAANALYLGEGPVFIGDRINPTGRADLHNGLRQGDLDPIVKEAEKQADRGVQALDLNVTAQGVDQPAMMEQAVAALQEALPLPLAIDSVNTTAMEHGLRRYQGKALINSANGRADSMRLTFPLAKKYGGMVVCLTLDETGLPQTPEEKLRVAEKILHTAESYGLGKKDLIFDPLVMSIKSGPGAAAAVLETVKAMKARGLLTMAAVSNISYGLPGRKLLESTFLAMVLEAGVDVIMYDPGVGPRIDPLAQRALLGDEEDLEAFVRAVEDK